MRRARRPWMQGATTKAMPLSIVEEDRRRRRGPDRTRALRGSAIGLPPRRRPEGWGACVSPLMRGMCMARQQTWPYLWPRVLSRRDFVTGLIAAAGGWAAVAAALRAAVDGAAAFAVSKETEELFQHAVSGDTLVYTEDYAPNLDPATLKAIRSSKMTYAFYDVSITPNGRAFDDCLRSVALWNASVARNGDTVLRAD